MRGILVHGGAGSRKANKLQLEALREALDVGYSLLMQKASALDVVERAIIFLEDSRLFNAGAGSRLQLDRERRMDASLMEGKDLRAGAVAGLQGIRNPIRVARLVMEKTPHLLLMGKGASRLARFFNLAQSRFTPQVRLTQWRKELCRSRSAVKLYRKIYGTVGVVACDFKGEVAAGASTGGVPFMLPGRVGDTPLIGCGIYADNRSGAVSMTGVGEGIIRSVLAYEICSRLENGDGPREAAESALRRMRRRIGGEAGAILITRKGEFAIVHTTQFMAAGWKEEREVVVRNRFRRISR